MHVRASHTSKASVSLRYATTTKHNTKLFSLPVRHHLCCAVRTHCLTPAQGAAIPKNAAAGRCVMVICPLGRSWFRALLDRTTRERNNETDLSRSHNGIVERGESCSHVGLETSRRYQCLLVDESRVRRQRSARRVRNQRACQRVSSWSSASCVLRCKWRTTSLLVQTLGLATTVLNGCLSQRRATLSSPLWKKWVGAS